MQVCACVCTHVLVVCDCLLTHVLRINVSRQWRVVTLLDLLAQRVQIHLVSIKWRLKGSHLIEETAKRPDVRTEIVAILMDPLRGHVIRSAHCTEERKALSPDTTACLIYHTLPREWAAVVLELKNRPSPKSPNFTTAEAVTKTFAGLMSAIEREDVLCY